MMRVVVTIPMMIGDESDDGDGGDDIVHVAVVAFVLLVDMVVAAAGMLMVVVMVVMVAVFQCDLCSEGSSSRITINSKTKPLSYKNT